jgi:thiol-disulfide isomerase/thioredoxin
MDYGAKFELGLEYGAFLDKYGTDPHRQRWASVHQAVELSAAQVQLLAGFEREMKVLVLAGAWCGDCANQCPIFDHFAKANADGKIRIRYFDRDADTDLAEEVSTCGGHRVPSVLFVSEDNFVCGRYGDRTLAKYRDLAAKQLGPSCPTGIGEIDRSLMAQVIQEWLNEFERIQLMLRLSGRLRKLHGD